MFPDFKELLESLRVHNVKYLIVGGYAVSFYAQPRATKDLDILIEANPVNAKAVYKALAGFGASLSGISADDLANHGRLFGSDASQLPSTFWPA